MKDNIQQTALPADFHYLPFVTIQQDSEGKEWVHILVSAPEGSSVHCERKGSTTTFVITITCPVDHPPLSFTIFPFKKPYGLMEGDMPKVRVYVSGAPGGPKRGTVSLPDKDF